MNECPQCETQWTAGRFCPDCLYHLPGPSLWARLRAWLHRAALTAGEVAVVAAPTNEGVGPPISVSSAPAVSVRNHERSTA